MTAAVLAALLALAAPAPGEEQPKTPEVANHTPFPATLVLSTPGHRIWSMVLKMTLKRNVDGSWQLAQGQEPLMDEAQIRRPETVLGCPVEPGTLADSLVFKPRAEVFVQRLSPKLQEIELRTPTAAVRAPVEDGCVAFDEGHGPWRVPWLEDGDTLEVRGIEERPVVVRLVRDFIPWALVRYEQGDMMPAPARLDTVLLAPRLDRAVFTWRATFPTAPEVRKVEFRAVMPDDFIEPGPGAEDALRFNREMRQALRRCAPPTGPAGEPCSVPTAGKAR